MLWIDGTKSAVADLDSRIGQLDALAGRRDQVLQVSKADRYRDRARHCVIKAGQAQRTEAKLSWLYLAQTWLGMIPEPQRPAADVIQAAVWDRKTRQEPASSQR